MTNKLFYKSLTTLIALVWLVNGLICKVLNVVPRHQEIVGTILGTEHAALITKVIGLSEILMAVWVFSGVKSRYNAILQITLIAAMNIIEFARVPQLLLWGRFNILFASLLIGVIYYNEFVLKRKLTQ